MNNHEKEMYDFAYRITKSAGFKLKSERKHSTIEIREKTSQMDIVTSFDISIEEYLTGAILEKYPEYAVLAEECHNTGTNGNPGYTWIIDPIDGTINFCRFARDYAISLALYYGNEPIFGLVYDVANDIMYSAGNGKVPAMNITHLHNMSCSESSLRKAVIGMSFRTIKELSDMGTDVFGLLSRAQAHRYLGCASLELCKIASGEYDLFISSNVYAWDIAAARILIEQSGGFLISCKKDKIASYSEKLFAAAFRSPELWEETLKLLPSNVKQAFGY